MCRIKTREVTRVTGVTELLTRLVGKVVYGACFGREADAYLVYLALVGGVWLGIALFVYLF